MAQAAAQLLTAAPVRPRTADQPDRAVRAVRAGDGHPRVDHARRASRSALRCPPVGEPRRLARQLFGITEGFFGPLFFVWLGASLQVRELGAHPALILLGVGLGAGCGAGARRRAVVGQPLTLAVLSAAQLGVPVAAATLGTEEHLLAPGEPSALMLGALITIACTSIAGALAARAGIAAKAAVDDPPRNESVDRKDSQ